MRQRNQAFLFPFLMCVIFLFSTHGFAKKKSKSKFPYHELMDKKFLKRYKAIVNSIQEAKNDEALSAAKKALSSFPNSPRLHVLIATIHKSKKKYADAARYFGLAAKKFKTSREKYEKAQCLYNVAFVFELKKDFVQAKIAWKAYKSFASPLSGLAPSVSHADSRIQAINTVIKNNK